MAGISATGHQAESFRNPKAGVNGRARLGVKAGCRWGPPKGAGPRQGALGGCGSPSCSHMHLPQPRGRCPGPGPSRCRAPGAPNDMSRTEYNMHRNLNVWRPWALAMRMRQRAQAQRQQRRRPGGPLVVMEDLIKSHAAQRIWPKVRGVPLR